MNNIPELSSEMAVTANSSLGIVMLLVPRLAMSMYTAQHLYLVYIHDKHDVTIHENSTTNIAFPFPLFVILSLQSICKDCFEKDNVVCHSLRKTSI